MERYGEVWRGVESCAPKEGSELALLTGKRYGEVWRGMDLRRGSGAGPAHWEEVWRGMERYGPKEGE